MELTDGMAFDLEKHCILYDSCMPLLMLRENQKINFLKEEENNSVKSQKPKINTRKRPRI
jgi:hypothetical protein